jgi:hypothetical protein
MWFGSIELGPAALGWLLAKQGPELVLAASYALLLATAF